MDPLALFSIESLVAFIVLVLLEIILGIDNVAFVSIILNKIEKKKRATARAIWIVIGLAIRIALIVSLGWLIQQKGKPVFTVFDKVFDLASTVLISGGIFLLYKVVKEIHHKLEGDEQALEANVINPITTFSHALIQVILIDMIFSVDTAITAMGVGNHMYVMIAAVLAAMVIMHAFSKGISSFMHKHPTFKMLGLAMLLVVAVGLIIEGWFNEAATTLRLKRFIYFASGFTLTLVLLSTWFENRSRKKVVELQEPVIKGEE